MKKARVAATRRSRAQAVEQKIDFGELPTFVGYQIRRAQAKIFGEFETMLKDFDLTPGSFGVLMLIWANPGIQQVTLAGAFGVDKSTMSPVIVRLEERGLIWREVLRSDRRGHALYLSQSAEIFFQAARQKVRAFEDGIAARLTKTEQRELGRLLGKLGKT
jgi:DNA-binding MarR family transcriptional regulator